MSSESPSANQSLTSASGKSFLNDDIHSHIRGVDPWETMLDHSGRLKMTIVRGGLLGAEVYRECATSLLKLLENGQFCGKVILITGEASSGKTALSVAIKRDSFLPVVAMEIEEVFTLVPSSTDDTMVFNNTATPAFTENLLRAVLIKDGKEYITLHQLNQQVNGKILRTDDGEYCGVWSGRIKAHLSKFGHKSLGLGALIIRGLKIEEGNEAEYVALLSNLQAAVAHVFSEIEIAPAVIVLADYSNSAVIDFTLQEDGALLPSGLTNELVYFTFNTPIFTEEEDEEIFLLRAQHEGVAIGEPVLKRLKELASESRRKQAHRILHSAVQLAKKKAAENGLLEKQVTITKAHFNKVVGEMWDIKMGLDKFIY